MQPSSPESATLAEPRPTEGSPAGAETVSFEGMRCENGERKLYAFGRADERAAADRKK